MAGTLIQVSSAPPMVHSPLTLSTLYLFHLSQCSYTTFQCYIRLHSSIYLPYTYADCTTPLSAHIAVQP